MADVPIKGGGGKKMGAVKLAIYAVVQLVAALVPLWWTRKKEKEADKPADKQEGIS